MFNKCIEEEIFQLESADEENDIPLDECMTLDRFQRTPNIDLLLVLFSTDVDVTITTYVSSPTSQAVINQSSLSKRFNDFGCSLVDDASPPKRHPRRFPVRAVTRVEVNTPKRRPNKRTFRSATSAAFARVISELNVTCKDSRNRVDVSTRLCATFRTTILVPS